MSTSFLGEWFGSDQNVATTLEARFSTLVAARRALADFQVPTRNLMNPDAGVVMIRAEDKGGCCDPGTEHYHCM